MKVQESTELLKSVAADMNTPDPISEKATAILHGKKTDRRTDSDDAESSPEDIPQV